MTAIKKTISIDEDVAKEASDLNSNFSAVVEAALVEYLHQHRFDKAVKSFGKWKDRKETSRDFVAKLRRKDDRECVTKRKPKNKNVPKS